MARYTPSDASTIPQVNAEFDKIKIAIDDTLSRKGDQPNSMEAPLDMNSERLYNLPEPIVSSDAATKRYVDKVSNFIPAGGQALISVDTVSDMINYDAKEFDYIQTRSYYGQGTDGSAVYEIMTATSYGGTPDGYGDHLLANGLIAKLISTGWITPEQYGANETASVDSLAFIQLLKKERMIALKPNKKYVLSSLVTGSQNSWEILNDNVYVHAYGASIELIGAATAGANAANNGIRIGDRSNINWFGGKFLNPERIFTQSISIYGNVNYVTLKDIDGDSPGQYHILVGGVNSSYNYLTVDNCRAWNSDANSNNEFSVVFEFFPQNGVSTNLVFTNNFAEMVGLGNCFKIHNADFSMIENNVFIRTSNVTNSLSQCVMIPGRSNTPANNTLLSGNRIIDQSSQLGAVYVGGGSSDVNISNNIITGNGDDIWIGGSATRLKIDANQVKEIKTIGATNNLTDVVVSNNYLRDFNTRSGNSVTPPVNVDGLFVSNNQFIGPIRLAASGTVDRVSVTSNSFCDVLADSIIDMHNVYFANNYYELDPLGNGTAQAVFVTGNNFTSCNNVYEINGAASRAIFLSGNDSECSHDRYLNTTLELGVVDSGTNNVIYANTTTFGTKTYTDTLQPRAIDNFTVATIPSAASKDLEVKYVSDMAGGAGPVYSDGSVWKRFSDNKLFTDRREQNFYGFTQTAAALPTGGYLPSGWSQSFTGTTLTITHNLGIAATDYQVQGQVVDPAGVERTVQVRSKGTNSFDVETYSGGTLTGNIAFDFNLTIRPAP